eukprot:g10110.t1
MVGGCRQHEVRPSRLQQAPIMNGVDGGKKKEFCGEHRNGMVDGWMSLARGAVILVATSSEGVLWANNARTTPTPVPAQTEASMASKHGERASAPHAVKVEVEGCVSSLPRRAPRKL